VRPCRVYEGAHDVTDPAVLAIRAARSALSDLEDAVTAAADAQWSSPPVPRAPVDTAERSKGLTSDPVPSVALDGRRLALRARVMEAERAAARMGVVARALTGRVMAGLERWEGTDDTPG
jgi:hypothetical protein